MSDEPEIDERGESYLEVQMDRSTIVLAAVGLVVLLAAAFLLGSWFGSRGKADADVAEASVATADDDAPEAPDPDEHDGEDVPSETGFGGKPVSARGAAPVGAVPTPRRGVASPPGPSAPLEEDVAPPSAPRRATAAKPTAPKATAAKATAARATAAKPTAAKATAAKPTAAKATAAGASAPAAAGSWIIQVAAVEDRAEAERLATKLRNKGWDVRLVEEAGYVKVQVGPFDTKTAAQAAEQRLKREEKLGTWLKKA
jgi:DedD protein